MIELLVLEEEAERRVGHAQKVLQEFSVKLADNPAHTMEWSAMPAFEKAADIAVWGTILEKRGKYRAGITDEEILNYFADKALSFIAHEARWPQRSTSPTSNLWAQSYAQSWAEVYYTIRQEF